MGELVPNAVIENLEAWYAAHADVPGMEVHRDPDITWMLSNGSMRSNTGTALRFEAGNAGHRLDDIFKQFAGHGRGIGLWVEDAATPADLADHLKRIGLRLKKRYPAMSCDLAQLPETALPEGIRIIRTPHHSMYLRHPHPYFGPITTPIRRHELNRLAHLAAEWPANFFDFVALAEGNRPVGACSMFISECAAGFYDVGVLSAERGRGIGTAMLAHALRLARDQGKKNAVLISLGAGTGVFRRAGFREVSKVDYWYRSLKA